MSPSWTKRWRRLLAPDTAAVMLSVTPDRLDAVWLDGEGTVQDGWDSEVAVIAGEQADAGSQNRLAQALQPLAGRLANQYARILVSVPDAAATANVFTFDRLPWRRSAQEKLLRWRLNRQRGADLDTTPLQWQPFRNGDGMIQVWTTTLAADWRNAVAGALADAGIVPAVLDIEGRYLFNWLHRRGHVGGKPAAMLNVSGHCFGLMVWDASGRPAWFRSRWRDRIAREHSLSDTERMLSELQRLVFTYAGTPDAVAFKRMYLAQTSTDDAGLADALSHQLGLEVMQLDGLVRSTDKQVVGQRRAQTLTMAMGQ